MRWLWPLLVLLALWASPAVRAGEPALVRGHVADVPEAGGDVWILVAERQEDLFRGEPDGAQRLDAGGAFEIALDPAPPELFVWLLADRDGDGPDADDPFTSHRPWPVPAGPGSVLELEPSLRGTAFLRARTLSEWVGLEVEQWVLWVGYALTLVLVMSLLVTGMGISRWSRPSAELPRETDPHPPAGSRWPLVASLIALTVVGLALRAWLAVPSTGGPAGISEHAWLALAMGGQGDESLFQRAMHPAALGSFKQILYLAVVRATGLWISPAPEAARLWSVLAGVATVPAMYALVRCWGRPLEGLVGAALVAVLPLGVFFGADASPYALHLLLTVLGTRLLVGAARGGGTRACLGFGLISVLAYYLHQLHAAVFAAQLAFLLVVAPRFWCSERQRRAQGVLRLFLAPAVVVIALWQVLVLAGSPFGAAFQQETGAFVVQQIGAWDLLGFSASVSAGTPMGQPWLVVPLGAFWLGGLALMVRRSGSEALLLLLLACGVLGSHVFSVGVMLATFDGGMNLVPHHLTVLQAVLVPLYAAAITWLLRRGMSAWVNGGYGLACGLVLLAALPLLAGGWGTVEVASRPGRPDTPAAAKVLRAQAQPGDAYLPLPGFVYDGVVGWHLFGVPAGDPTALPDVRRLVSPADAGSELLGPLDSLRLPAELLLPRPDVERLWVVAFSEERFGRPKLNHARLTARHLEHVERFFELVETWPFEHVELRLYQREATPHDLSAEPLALGHLGLLEHRALRGGSQRLFSVPPAAGPASRFVGPRNNPVLALPVASPLEAPLRLELELDSGGGCLLVELEGCDLLRQPAVDQIWTTPGPCRVEERAVLRFSQQGSCRDAVTITRVELGVDENGPAQGG